MDTTRLIYKVLLGLATEAERDQLDEWIAMSEANRQEFDDLKLLWEKAQQPDGAFSRGSTDDGLNRIKAMVASRRKSKGVSPRRGRLIFIFLAIIPLTAFILFALDHPVSSVTATHLKFENTSVENLIKTIKAEYDIDIAVQNQGILVCSFTGTINKSSSSEEIVKAIVSALDLEYNAIGTRSYEIRGRGCKDRHPD